MLGWAGLRGAIADLARDVPGGRRGRDASSLFNIVFFVVLTSTLVQGATFEPLARRARLTTDRARPATGRSRVAPHPAPRREILVFRLRDDDAVGRPQVKDPASRARRSST